jgi:hypothetical protein
MAKKNWIQTAIKRPGAFKKKAKHAGMGTSAYANRVMNTMMPSSTTFRQAALAKTLAKLRKKKGTK